MRSQFQREHKESSDESNWECLRTGSVNPEVRQGDWWGRQDGGKEEGGSFTDVLSKAIGEVESMQKDADVKVASLVTGNGDVTPHDAMIALEKADVAFNLMTQIRSKIVRAYEEVMRTQV